MDVYLSARFGRRKELRELAQQLEAAGVHVTSRWINQVADVWTDPESLAPAEAAYLDLSDIRRAQVFVFFSEEPDVERATRGARHVEFGIALAKQKRLVVVGPVENVFHHVDGIQRFDTAAAALEQLVADAEVQRRAGW